MAYALQKEVEEELFPAALVLAVALEPFLVAYALQKEAEEELFLVALEAEVAS